MSVGRLEVLFEIDLQGLDIQEETKFHVHKLGLEAQFQPGTPLGLSVRIEAAEEPVAEGLVARFVQELYQRLLLRFGANINRSTPPRSVRRIFTTPATASSPSVTSTSATHRADAFLVERPPVVLPAAELAELAHEVEVRAITPSPLTLAQLYTAIAMYVAGLESQNKVLRFLVFYSALALAALFKWHDGSQSKVDGSLLERNSRLTVSPSPKNPMVNETLYTTLRNNLIHAAERGCDPARAIAAIESNIEQFQRDVALVMSHL